VLLSAPPKEGDMVADDSDVDPILAYWHYGLGSTAAFTSDLTDDWGKDWVKWDQFRQLVTQMATQVSRVRKEEYLRVYTYVNGNEGVVVVEDFHPEEMLLDMSVNVTAASGFQYSGAVRQIAPRRYQTTIPLQGKARYQVKISTLRPDAKNKNTPENAYAGFIVSYSPEYLRFDANPIALRNIAEQTGGMELDPDKTPEDLAAEIYGRRNPVRSSRPVFDWFLMALACLIPLDVAVRRVQLDFSWLTGMFSKRNSSESTATMGALLERTKSVRSTLQDTKEATRSKPPERPMQPRAAVPPRPNQRSSTSDDQGSKPTGQAPPPDKAGDNANTTSRLLAMKRKREQEDGD